MGENEQYHTNMYIIYNLYLIYYLNCLQYNLSKTKDS